MALPTKLQFRLGEQSEGQGYDLDKKDHSRLDANPARSPWLSLHPVSVLSYRDSAPDHVNRELKPGVNGSAFANGDPKVRASRKIQLKLAVHDGYYEEGQPNPKVAARAALDEMNYWLFTDLRGQKLHVWDRRYVNYFVNGYRLRVAPGMPANAFEIDTELLCADPYMYDVESDGFIVPFTGEQVWAGGTTNRRVGDDIAFPFMSVKNNHATLTYHGGVQVIHKEMNRTMDILTAIPPGYTVHVVFATQSADLRAGTTPGSKVRVGGVPIWLLPDGNTNTLTVQRVFPNQPNQPANTDIRVDASWPKKYQV